MNAVAQHSSLSSFPAKEPVLVTACAWCDRVLLGHRWVEAQEAIQRLRTYENDAPPSFTHTICDPCSDNLERRRAARQSQ